MTVPSFTDSLNELQAVLEASAALENQVASAGAAIIHALEQGCKLMTCGNGGGKASGICDFAICVPSANTARIQEVHTLIFHHWLEMIESKTWG